MASDDLTHRFVSRLTRTTLAVVLAGGRGTRLSHLTNWRAKPAVPFGGKFRIVDFTLSNCINSGIRRIAVLTQYRPYSLIRHIQRGWSFLHGEFGEFIGLFPASQRVPSSSWYAGTADAVYQNLGILSGHEPELVLVLAGDHVYKMDYGPMLAFHVDREADMTVGCIEVPVAEARQLGVMEVDESRRIIGFEEKPGSPKPVPGNPGTALGSMGIYVFNFDFLCERLVEDAEKPGSTHDFGKDLIPSMVGRYRLAAYPFRSNGEDERGYWRDVGTVDAYWKANMELIGVVPELNLYDRDWPIWTYQEQLPPAKFVFDEWNRRGTALNSMVSGGCIIAGATLRRTLLFSGVIVDERSVLEDAVVLPHTRIGRDCTIRKAVLDSRCVVPDGTIIGLDRAHDAARFHVSDGGVVLVTPEMLGQTLQRGG